MGATAAGEAFGQASDRQGATLSEIVVTAQKREQNLQDVPIAVTAVTQATLEANRITDVTSLTSLAPNLTVQGGLPTIGLRGLVSQGTVAGQDKSVPIYIDGVSIGSTLGSVFDLPDLERIEVLRGPQGTLFGRNATGGAISVITRNPSGRFGLRQALTVGNYDQFKSVTRIETPAWGPFSASVSYTHEERTGEMKNLGAGMVWDRSAAGQGTAVSPKTLGDKDTDSWFVAVKFEPSDSFSTVYKYDRMVNRSTSSGTALIAFTPEGSLGPAFGGLVRALYNANPIPIAGAHRPKYVNNWWTIPGRQKVYGHNLTSNWRVNDQLALKNILSYRYSTGNGTGQITGAGGLRNIFPALGPVGAPYALLEANVENSAKQWSDEVQLNYDSERLTLTAGAIYFNLHTHEGAPVGIARINQFSVIPGGVIPRAPLDLNVNYAEAWAGYAQAEAHLTPQLDLVGGYRLTKDKKWGTNYVGGRAFPFTYNKTRPSYLVGVNYKPTPDVLLYGKYSTGFVAGGVTSTIVFAPETVKAWEGGLKADLLERRLRLNIAAFAASYKNIQATSGGAFITPPRPELGTIVVTQGDLKTKGAEVEIVLAPARGVSLGGSAGHTDYDYSNLNPILGTPGNFVLQYRAKWTAQLWAQYESEPLFDEARLWARLDGNWRSRIPTFNRAIIPAGFEVVRDSPAGWVLNGRVALRDIKLARGSLEVALWATNLTDSDRILFPINFGFLGSTGYEPPRRFGLDVIYNY